MELAKKGYTVSRRRIGRIMKQECLVSSYTVAQYKPHVDKCNESNVQNIVNREFSDQPQYNVVVSDLTYVRVGNSWNYIYVLVDLFNREIIGYSAGKNKDTLLVSKAFSRVDINLNKIQIFHTDRGNEFLECLKKARKWEPGQKRPENSMRALKKCPPGDVYFPGGLFGCLHANE